MVSVKDQLSLENKTVLITGGSGFLGSYFAHAICEMGGTSILLDVDKLAIEKSIKSLQKEGFTADGYVLNITNKGQIKEVIRNIVKQHKTIDGLINAAAFAMKDMNESKENFFKGFEDYNQSLWQLAIDVNLTGTFLVTQIVGENYEAK